MLENRYNPFRKRLEELTGADLSLLKEVYEGWYVEYKSQPIETRKFAKSLSAFANHYGGWLFVGIATEGSSERTPSGFPGLEDKEVSIVEERLREASRTCINPSVLYKHTIIHGPVPEIGLPEGRSIVIVVIEQGPDTPYVHIDGCIYRRIADSSDPKPETDRTVLDLLWQRGERARRRLETLATRQPEVSQGEGRMPVLHIFMTADPYEQMVNRVPITFEQFVSTMKKDPIPFDNFFASNEGLVARQLNGNPSTNRGLTWDHYREGHSFMTLPLNCFYMGAERSSLQYVKDFFRILEDSGYHNEPVLDLNRLFIEIGAACVRQRFLVATQGDHGPFYVKLRIENAWRHIPFLDAASYIQHIKTHGVPLIQSDDVLAPPGMNLRDFIILNPVEDLSSNEKYQMDIIIPDASAVALAFLPALGIPVDFLIQNTKDVAEAFLRAHELVPQRLPDKL